MQNMGKYNNSIPERWEPYTALGKPIPGTRFLAFKVPLKLQISCKVDYDKRFTPKNLIERVPNLGLVIDLTNTSRYYNHLEITKHGVEYLKVACVGRALPSSVTVNRFFKAVDDFLKDNADNDKLIGVHCTHGVNRTGYFICKYMIAKMNFDPSNAIESFNEARGHKIEREIYINGLVQDEPLGTVDAIVVTPQIRKHCRNETTYPSRKPDRIQHSNSSSTIPLWRQHLLPNSSDRRDRIQHTNSSSSIPVWREHLPTNASDSRHNMSSAVPSNNFSIQRNNSNSSSSIPVWRQHLPTNASDSRHNMSSAVPSNNFSIQRNNYNRHNLQTFDRNDSNHKSNYGSSKYQSSLLGNGNSSNDRQTASTSKYYQNSSRRHPQ